MVQQDPEIPTSTKTLAIVGKRLMYIYENGWLYELYVKNATTIDYRLHSGMVAGRWVKDQKVKVELFAGNLFKVSWCEPTGTAVSLCINLQDRQHYGVIFFPWWVHLDASKTVLFQNEHLTEMWRLRDTGPTYPIEVVNEFAEFVLVEDVGVDNENVISVSPTEFAPELRRICDKANLDHILTHFGEGWGSRDLMNLVGTHLGFTYRNGWKHELYVRTTTSIDYKISSSPGTTCHLLKDQEASISRLKGSNRYSVSWSDKSCGVSASLALDLDKREIHGVHFLPQWVLKHIKQLSLHSQILSLSPDRNLNSVELRDTGNTYPLHHIVESSDILFVEDRGVDDDSIIC